jgi:hypothetical protein
MRFLLADPYNVIEFAERGVHEPNMATYVAFETMPGAFLHLFVLGVAMGSVLGAFGWQRRQKPETVRRQEPPPRSRTFIGFENGT